MPEIPRETTPDSTLAMVRDPYRWIARRCRAHGSALFEARLLLEPAICMTGHEAARLFYDESRFIRRDAMPMRVNKTLFGVGGVHGLDDQAHRVRKAMFMSLMTPERVAALRVLVLDEWRKAAARWTFEDRVTLYDAVRPVISRAICAWAGVPIADEAELGRRTEEFHAMFQYAGSVGPKHWYSRRCRGRAEHWARELIEAVRAGNLEAAPGTALSVIATHHDIDGELLDLHVAAVELLNVLRPTVAAATYVAFIAHALHQHPAARELVANGGIAEAEAFGHEVRRLYPFVPVMTARARTDFSWSGYDFPKGRRVLLDLFGINRDPSLSAEPDRFDPGRFLAAHLDAFAFVPQGGGDPRLGHRCPGEASTVALMTDATRFLVHELSYELPEQDLTLNWSGLPALPRSGMVLGAVRLAA